MVKALNIQQLYIKLVSVIHSWSLLNLAEVQISSIHPLIIAIITKLQLEKLSDVLKRRLNLAYSDLDIKHVIIIIYIELDQVVYIEWTQVMKVKLEQQGTKICPTSLKPGTWWLNGLTWVSRANENIRFPFSIVKLHFCIY